MHAGLGETNKDVLNVDNIEDESTKQIIQEKNEKVSTSGSGFRRK